ncbi:MAG: cytochrome C assembly family protein [Pseudomonadota bacterium]|uniref:cytochrome C assembly family protein n=1 Tax=Sulfuricystis thermophila TaxID=2496847 RepID=UPI001035C536|nr:cytochrome c biogenesis protein CcsA [Sulfuricystis thermophila]MDI6749707.1 cytochrome c biogenesis protein CcsA [Rhodocyclaceae bacterium]
MPTILLHPPLPHLLAALLYVGLAFHFWRTRWRGAVLDQPVKGLAIWERTWLFIALVIHGMTLGIEVHPAGFESTRFGFAVALSLMMWLAVAFYWVESFYARMEGLQMLGLPLAALCTLLPLLIPSQHILANAGSLAFRIHLLMAMLAYSLFTLAALHAILMAIAEKRLHRGRMTPLFAGLPPLLTMENLLFRLIHIAFFLLTLTLASGILFSEQIFGKALPFNHKTVFALLSWIIFAWLLAGRHFRGWRGRIALRWTLAGFVTLLLAYVGSRFVLEVLLGRPG